MSDALSAPAWSSRRQVEDAIEMLISLLDALDPDPDLEEDTHCEDVDMDEAVDERPCDDCDQDCEPDHRPERLWA
ncbi:hypothetical protein GCM10007874_11500 [Labrys miyagiensis]|uniref:Uncharacterized protein n=1 Tax=Labrys miyagiensis TaxID=346912 RepID=A0ABQ6CHD7_9HYPH|nr:hypothetical protein [Labrys miyagiensis]GLS18134.1 hypothetical protein GCM10007874_11500 [Labrys miyagiensis]